MQDGYDEVFHLQGNTEGEYLMIKVTGTEMSPENDLFFSDIMHVEYKGQPYTIHWDDYDACYAGRVDGKYGYVY
ncbi:hypothetical protein DSS3PM1_00013 [Bacteriophage DSS3_PM1]|uniref:Uncharacterized protein n=1 Tax=Bacteriophage DSS3_VP1 TaxID=2664196 RepID=A0A7S5FQJ2_9CAUD|nr:hypothetical protein KNU84_gp052 [Bacteriophage DSS3_VP1]QGH74652.1 hypothetical protein DSS3VP1_00084 [Bacteriophage DSS3_VP1]QGH74690.1 hypothetical protein DSS3PM1_00013 [Bacteriophage DSS3_PM1]